MTVGFDSLPDDTLELVGQRVAIDSLLAWSSVRREFRNYDYKQAVRKEVIELYEAVKEKLPSSYPKWLKLLKLDLMCTKVSKFALEQESNIILMKYGIKKLDDKVLSPLLCNAMQRDDYIAIEYFLSLPKSRFYDIRYYTNHDDQFLRSFLCGAYNKLISANNFADSINKFPNIGKLIFNVAIEIRDLNFVKRIIKLEPNILSIEQVFSGFKTLNGELFEYYHNLNGRKKSAEDYRRESHKLSMYLCDAYNFTQQELNSCLAVVVDQLYVDIEMLNILLAKGANPNYKFIDSQKRETSILLIATQRDLFNCEHFKSCYPKHIHSHVSAISCLLANGANVNAVIDNENKTALHHFVEHMFCGGYQKLPGDFHSSILKELIKGGADPYLQDIHGKDCFAIAGSRFKENGLIFQRLVEGYRSNHQPSRCLLM